ncbi:MAG: hypothetical protein Ct9H90mP8_2870 [Pseudomonadota bacterium]|nr:MAG: hypothetical protein Ct9H90mP8_2870 [Pseudomonadota bacterium]
MKFLCRNPKDFFKISRDDEYSLREFPGKALIGVLFQKDEIYQQFLRHLETIEVEIELESEIYKFDSTDYYQEEMGSGLYRIFLSLKGLYPVEQSVSLKNETNSWENEWKEAGKRTLILTRVFGSSQSGAFVRQKRTPKIFTLEVESGQISI